MGLFLYTKTAMFCTPTQPEFMHQHSCVLCAAVLVHKPWLHFVPQCGCFCTPTRPCFVHQHSWSLCTNTAVFYAPTQLCFVHRMQPCWCTNHDHTLFPNAAVFCRSQIQVVGVPGQYYLLTSLLHEEINYSSFISLQPH